MNVLHVYHPRMRPYAQEETQNFLAKLPPTWQVHDVEAWEDSDYFQSFRAAVTSGEPFINVEQDIVPTIEVMEELAACPRLACTVPYRLKHGPWSLWQWADPREPTWTPEKPVRYYPDSPHWVEGSSLGLVKIAPGAISVTKLQALDAGLVPYYTVDQVISSLVGRQLGEPCWHVHRSAASFIKHHRPAVD